MNIYGIYHLGHWLDKSYDFLIIESYAFVYPASTSFENTDMIKLIMIWNN